MRELTGRDELQFSAGRGPTSRLVGLLAALGGEPQEQLRERTLATWEAGLLDLRARLLGSQVHAEVRCPGCGTGLAVDFDAGDLPHEAAPAAGPLPLASLTVGDLLDLEESGEAGEPALALLLAAAARTTREAAAEDLHGPGRDALVNALEGLAAGLGLELGTRCAECGVAFTSPFDVAQFLDAEIGLRAGRLLDEVHLIASTYHWSEAEILDLPQGRRQEYLDRILLERPATALFGAVA